VYTGDRTQSPIDATLAQHLQNIASQGTGQAAVFAKVGDSITASDQGVAGGQFLNCFDGVLEGNVGTDYNIHLGASSAMAPTIGYFKAVALTQDGGTSWSRASLAAKVGLTAQGLMSSSWDGGAVSYLDDELQAIKPRYAVVMFGSNDIYYYDPTNYPVVQNAEWFEHWMRTITDHLLAKGVIPVLTTMPPRWGSSAAGGSDVYLRTVPVFTAVVRGIAQGRQIPLIDYNREMMALPPPTYGLGSDGVHPTIQDYNTACWLDAVSLATYGYNVRNQVTLDAMDRMRLIAQGVELDPGAARLAGVGSWANPFVVPSVPFAELRDLSASSFTAAGPSACPGAPTISGPEYLYQVTLAAPTPLRILVLDQGPRALRVSVWTGATPDTCIHSDPSLIARTLPAGTYTIAVDAPFPAGASEYNLSVTRCLDTDPGCPP
jgi:lysophospholipase L1-like esterase